MTKPKRWTTWISVLALAATVLVLSGPSPAGAGPGTCFGMAATIVAVPGVPTVGTSGPDVIVGTSGPDDIKGKGGADKICSKKGNDTVSGGKGDDMINLGKGHDTATGDEGSDLIKGAKGEDDIEGNKGNDDIYGGKATDTCKGGKSHQDELYSCNEPDPWLAGKRSIGPDGVSGTAGTCPQVCTMNITKSGPSTYPTSIRGAFSAPGTCGAGVFPVNVDGTATGTGGVLSWDYTLTCKGGSTEPPIAVTGGTLTLRSDARVLFEVDWAGISSVYG